jgi:hypothetical protein
VECRRAAIGHLKVLPGQLGPAEGGCGPAGMAGDHITQLPRQPLQHRGFQQERAHLRRLAVNDLIGQVVQHETVAAAERRRKPGRIRTPRSDSPASCSPAAHPSVRAASAATAVSGRPGPQWNPSRAHPMAVARFVHWALAADLPPGWYIQPDQLRHTEPDQNSAGPHPSPQRH